ncbi:hypothetical protein PN925_001201 [Morganella morganii]|uniref:Uncharacterized protein n=1 Tax=Morganella morganii TaxID=582 RepID=A0AAI9HQG1_MORMO|nr:hypothetical protein [Providencia stuartii]EIU9514634.1 hypothetical protein [Providencia rettgeri]EKW8760476.1 hypothetical protein [Morganella morganii]EKH6495287.1 hypothetical protein [Providencia rettgeri]EMA4644867.1 hypothetical protein [Providencia rettgeri]WRR96261.1 hypothetical protein VNI59_16130 [Providencia rettgeri]
MAAKITIVIKESKHGHGDVEIIRHKAEPGTTKDEMALSEELVQEVGLALCKIKLAHKEKRNAH